MDLKYIDSNIGKKKLRKAKMTDLLYLIIFILGVIIYGISYADAEKIRVKIVFLIIYIIISLIIILIKRKHTNKVIAETMLQEICLDGFINLNIYNAKKHFTSKKVYNYYLCNIIQAYIRKGDFEQANNLISFLEKKKIGNTIKALLIQYKADIAFYKNDVEEFKAQADCFGKISDLIPEKIANKISLGIKLKKYIIENNVCEADKICEQLARDKELLTKIVASYYKGIILEKNKNEEYKECYKFVVENGNDLFIAKIASEKLGTTQKVVYKSKKHMCFKIFTSFLLMMFLLISIFLCYYAYEKTRIKWDTGIIYINNEKINLPCKISEIESTLNVKIDTTKIDELGFYKLYLQQDEFNIASTTVLSGKYIYLYIDDDTVTGIEIDISNLWNDELDTELGDMVIFPEDITANNTIERIQKTYKTGKINFFMRDWSEDIFNSSENKYDYSYGFKYSGNEYDIEIKSYNEKVESIFYYYK